MNIWIFITDCFHDFVKICMLSRVANLLTIPRLFTLYQHTIQYYRNPLKTETKRYFIIWKTLSSAENLTYKHIFLTHLCDIKIILSSSVLSNLEWGKHFTIVLHTLVLFPWSYVASQQDLFLNFIHIPL